MAKDLSLDLGAAPEPYRVLARKYRPSDFTGLIGQEALVRTLSNAFATGRIAHAFMLTGVRGVGKTTLLSRMLRTIPGYKVAFSLVLNPTLSCDEFLESALVDFGTYSKWLKSCSFS